MKREAKVSKNKIWCHSECEAQECHVHGSNEIGSVPQPYFSVRLSAHEAPNPGNTLRCLSASVSIEMSLICARDDLGEREAKMRDSPMQISRTVAPRHENPFRADMAPMRASKLLLPHAPISIPEESG
jgi:hypothetical protein